MWTLVLASVSTTYAIASSFGHHHLGWTVFFVFAEFGLCVCAAELARLENLTRD